TRPHEQANSVRPLANPRRPPHAQRGAGMSMSVPGDLHRPGTKKAGAKAVAAGGKPDESETSDGAEASSAGRSGAKASTGATGTKAGARPGSARVAVKAGGRPASARPAGARPAGKGGGKGRKPVGPVKVVQPRNWGPIVMFAAAGVVAIAII